MKRLFISFSGGETSAFMLIWILSNWANKYDEIKVVFANTGQENEKTLIFVKRVAEYLGVEVVWVEAVIDPRPNKGTTHKVVTFETANRDGSVFEEMIKAYGIPNQSWKHCNRELKLNAMTSYIRSIGWEPRSYDTAIGIRADEMDRISDTKAENNLVYPFISARPTTKQEVNVFWRDMPFRLGLKGYEGNCKWCWKKSLRKHLTIISEHPEHYDFPRRMEQLHGKAGRGIEEGTGCNEDGQRVFFRSNRSTNDLFEMAKFEFAPAFDDATNYEFQLKLFDQLDELDELDISNGCEESCEVYDAA